MSFLGIEFAQAMPHYRKKRFAAFLADLAIVISIWCIAYQLTGKPDFFAVKAAMDTAYALPVEEQQAAMNQVFAYFDVAFQQGLLIWFAYEALTTVIFQGATLGKLLMGLRIVPMNPNRNRALHIVLLIVRSGLKMLTLYLLQGFPFIICALTVLTTSNRSGFDMFVKTQVVQRRAAKEGAGRSPSAVLQK